MFSTMKLTLKRAWIFLYPLFFSLFPILALYTFNIEYVHYTAILRSVQITLAVVFPLIIFLNLLIRDSHKASIITFFVILLWFSYGHVFNFFESNWPDVIQNRHLTALWFLLLLMGGWGILTRLKKSEGLSKFLQVASLTLLILVLINAATFEFKRMRANAAHRQQVTALAGDELAIDPENLPDIYYLILDAHTRSDILLDSFQYDNTDFIAELEEIGFYVADCSQTNYWRTEYSLSSTLNLNYLQDFLDEPNTLPDWKYSVLHQTLDQLGYTKIGFESRATHNVDLGVDVILSRRSDNDIYEDIYPFTNLNEYEVMLIKTTWLQSWLQLLANFQQHLPEEMILDAENAAYLEHYRQTLYILDELQRVPYRESPKFVMAHLLVPHEPFIFNPDGRYDYHHTVDEFVEGYRNNTAFIDSVLPDVLQKIIARSPVPPVIIVQGDHGPNGTAADMLLPILNAYYLPDAEATESLYPKITPVNSYRVIFNHFFGTNYPLLDDVSYYSQSEEFEQYQAVPVMCP